MRAGYPGCWQPCLLVILERVKKTISVSMGVASTQEAGCDYDSLFRCADQALYVVKHSGKKGYYNYYHKENAIDAATSAVSPIDAEGKEESE